MDEEQIVELRKQMVQAIALHAHFARERLGKDALDPRVLAAMGRVPRHEFVPADLRPYAYLDQPLPIGCGKTISQPFIVALMTDLLDLQPGDTVLEVGTGLGYQAAILGELAGKVFSVELLEELAVAARQNLSRLGYENIEIRVGDGSRGWPEHAPFDKIVVAAGAEHVPAMLLDQLKPGGRIVLPAGPADAQELVLVEKDASGHTSTRTLIPVRFSRLEAVH